MPDPDPFVVTPYEVKGRIDYDRLRELFGTQEITPALLDRLRTLAGGLFQREAFLAPIADAAVHGNHVGVAHLLQVVRSQS